MDVRSAESRPLKVSSGFGLFENLLEHKMGKITLFDLANRPVNPGDFKSGRFVLQCFDRQTIPGNNRQVVVVQINNIVGSR